MDMKPILPDLLLFIFGIATLVLYALLVEITEENFIGVHRVIIALAAAAVSIALPGFLSIGKKEPLLKSIDPKIYARGALAVFVIVYLFNPISF